MSAAVHLDDYRVALATPAARGPVIAAVPGRLPIAMVGFSALLYVQRTTGSFATAGSVSAAILLGVAIGSVAQGRVMDRIGPTKPLLVASGLFGSLAVVLILCIESHIPVYVLVPVGVALGAVQPTVGSVSRTMWMRILPPGKARTAALNYEAIATELYFVVGPALSGALILAPWPGTGLGAGAAMMAVGTVWYALTPTIRSLRPTSGERGRSPLVGALASPGLRTLVIAALGLGVVIGFVEVAVPAQATRAGDIGLGGLLIGAWGATSVVSGFIYGSRPWPRTLPLRVPLLLGAFAIAVASMSLTGGLVALTIVMLIAGLIIAPQTSAQFEAVQYVVLDGFLTESFGWLVTASTVGIGLGQGLSGQVVAAFSVRAAFMTAGALGSLLALAVYLRKNTFHAAATAAQAPFGE